MENIDYFAELLSSVQDIYLWTYDAQGKLLKSNCPYEEEILGILNDAHVSNVAEAAKKHNRPTILTSDYGTMWVVDSLKKDGQVEYFYLIGPFYMDAYPSDAVQSRIEEIHASLERKEMILDKTKKIPVISLMKIMDYTTMMHYAITGEKIYAHDLHFSHVQQNTSPSEESTFHGSYDAEREMLRMVREGDMRIVDQLQKMSTTSYVGKLANDDSEPLRQIKNTVFVAITLFSRAAIEGGVYPDTAMTLTDYYFQAIEAADTFQEISDITIAMQTDFVNRVRKIKHNNPYSKSTNRVIDYIELHLEDDIFLTNIASELGYSDYYLSKKFKQETGTSLKEYIRDQRLERSRFLLESENSLSLHEISERLKFSSESYFIDCFRKKYGTTPKQYRLNYTKQERAQDQ